MPSTRRHPATNTYRRASVACTFCRTRKVRCDVSRRGGQKCTNCEIDQVPCVVNPPTRAGRKPTSVYHDTSRTNQILPGTACSTEENLFEVKYPAHLDQSQHSILRRQEAMSMPSTELMNEILSTYIGYIHPRLPFLELSVLSSDLRKGVSAGTFSLLVLQALTSAALVYVKESSVENAGYKSPREASRAYYAKAKVISSCRCYGISR
jgi:hypothetical protein